MFLLDYFQVISHLSFKEGMCSCFSCYTSKITVYSKEQRFFCFIPSVHPDLVLSKIHKNGTMHSVHLLSNHSLKPAILVNYPGRFSMSKLHTWQWSSMIQDQGTVSNTALLLLYHLSRITGWWTCGHGWAWTASSTIQLTKGKISFQVS